MLYFMPTAQFICFLHTVVEHFHPLIYSEWLNKVQTRFLGFVRDFTPQEARPPWTQSSDPPIRERINFNRGTKNNLFLNRKSERGKKGGVHRTESKQQYYPYRKVPR